MTPEKPAPAPEPFCSGKYSTVQRAWDSYSLSLYLECPRKYYYAIIEGWRSRRTKGTLEFGIFLHRAMEVIHHAKARGASHEEVMLEAVTWALENTGEEVFVCAECNKLPAEIGPTTATEDVGCKNCGSTDLARRWVPFHTDEPSRNIITLCRAVVWYCEQYKNDAVRTVRLASGRAAVEHSFRLALPIKTPEGDSYILCGHIDALGLYGPDDDMFVKEHKHTIRSFNKNYFDQFSPNTQISCYSFSGKVIADKEAKGVMIDAIQVAVNFVRFQRQFAYRTQAMLDEWLGDTCYWIGQAENCATNNWWPMNDASCDKYGGCAFRDVCQKDPAVRQEVLKQNFKRDRWNPLQNRDT